MDRWKVIVFIVCINRFLHFHGIYILEYKAIKAFFKSYQKIIHFPNKTESFWYFCLWVYYFCFRARRNRSFPLPEKNKKMGKFWKFGRCYRNAIYCQIEIGKLKTLRKKRKRNFITTWRFMRTFVANKKFRLLTFFVSFSKKKKLWSSLGILCYVVTHTYAISEQTYFKYLFYWNQNGL